MSEKVDYKGDEYVKFRPNYPKELYSIIYEFYEEKTNEYEKAIDIGTGTGQVASELAQKFKQVYGVDRLPDMINHAIQKENIQYSLSDAEDLSRFEDHSMDLITVGTAFHWFNFDMFYKETKRVLKPNSGVLAIWTYFFSIIKDNEELNNIIKKKFIEPLLPYSDPKIHHAMTLYREIDFPFKEVDRYICPKSEDLLNQSKKVFNHSLLEKEMTLDQYASYLKTASGYVTYKKEHPEIDEENDPVDSTINAIADHLGVTDKRSYVVHLQWPLVLVLCRD
ncbi:S-adenosyl-L-methionine-dependent methyltransferase [Cunninghamella echinulata]|nr:S-adenosyl-L-methionine-dependent methyltransferase [Cunninghamella echinulata]